MARRARTRIEEGIFADVSGLASVVAVGNIQKEKRWPADTPRETLREWRATTRARLLKSSGGEQRQRSDPRSLARSIAAYLKRRKGRVGYKSDRSHLKAWIAKLGDRRRHQITKDDCEAVIAIWRADELSEKTIQHRVRVLREMYQALDSKDIDHPLKGIALPKPVRAAPIPVSGEIIRTVATSLLRGKTARGYGSDPIKGRAWFLVYATCGQRPSQIGRAKPGDVDLERCVWFVRPAKGGDPIPLPLNDDMVFAWRTFIAANAWGGFDPSSFAKLLRRHGWPKGVRPYALRHTFAIDLLLSGADLGDIQGFLGHASIQTTRQFYAPILLARLQQTVMKRSLNLSPVPATSVPAKARTRRQNPRQIRTVPRRIRYTKKGVSTRKRP